MKDQGDPLAELACRAIESLTGKTPSYSIVQVLLYIVLITASCYFLSTVTLKP